MAVTCRCGRPIVRGTVLPWTHLVNPGRDHHYAAPRRGSTLSADVS